MKPQHFPVLCCLLFFLLLHCHAFPQCINAPVVTCSAGPAAIDGESLPAGVTKWFNGATPTFNDYTLKGGTLIVCSDLTIDKFTMDSGTLFIQPGIKLVIGNGIGAGLVLRGSSAIYNYGTLEIQRNLSLENGWSSSARPNIICNATPASVLYMQNQYFVINNIHSWFINKGKAYFHGLITDPQAAAGSVCLGTGSETKMTVLYNKVRNSYAAPDGSACVHVSEFSQLWDTLTPYPQVNMCLGAGHRTDSSCMLWGCKPLAWGRANLFRGCTGCVAIQFLPVGRFLSFDVLQATVSNELRWELEGATPGGVFTIERSGDNTHYSRVKSITLNTAYPGTHYSEWDHTPPAGLSYYRVKYAEPGEQEVVYSHTLRTERVSSASPRIWPNPATTEVHLSLPCKGSVQITIHDMNGKKIMDQFTVAGNGSIKLSIPSSAEKGLYILTVVCAMQQYKLKFIRN
ncbi:MAG: T9SS type A sorting domain-containing protein [Bacteroidetes bacterium]|nr:T9SS type A sorting domain-containing protein [Bacteroidota bacterium]